MCISIQKKNVIYKQVNKQRWVDSLVTNEASRFEK